MEQDENGSRLRLSQLSTPSVIQPTATIINISMLNSAMAGNGSNTYIFDPNQTVLYQTPMNLQPYITLPAHPGETYTMPVGLPVSASILPTNQNVLISTQEYPVDNNKIMNHYPSNDQPTFLNLNSTPQQDGIKKNCPLEMSIKAAKIDLDFDHPTSNNRAKSFEHNDRSKNNGMIVNLNGVTQLPSTEQTTKTAINNITQQHVSLPEPSQVNQPTSVESLNVCVPDVMTVAGPSVLSNVDNLDESSLSTEQLTQDGSVLESNFRSRTVITWDNQNESNHNDEFQESLICEVEEANDEGSSEDDNDMPLSSVVLKLRKVKDDSDVKKETSNDVPRKRSQRTLKRADATNYMECWSDSDDEILGAKKFKVDNSDDLSNSENDSEHKKMTRVRSCCTKRQCYKAISQTDQKLAQKYFKSLETKEKQNSYLINCLEHVSVEQTASTTTSTGDKHTTTIDNTIQEDIENESNGNQSVSDEIQKAINESLKELQKEEVVKVQETVKPVKRDVENRWIYYVVIERSKKIVCQQFLMKLFGLKKRRIKDLQRMILTGDTSLDETSTRSSVPHKVNEKYSQIWSAARQHLAMIPQNVCQLCTLERKHIYLNSEDANRKILFQKFQEYYMSKYEKEVDIKYESYRRFLSRETKFSFQTPNPNCCAECSSINEHKRREKARTESINNLNKKTMKKVVGRKRWETSSDSDDVDGTDNLPLSKQKELKLKISLKGKKCSKKNVLPKKSKKKGKEDKPQCKGRDVWSLMLLHLQTIDHVECRSCLRKRKHKFFSTSVTTQKLYEEYRKFFLKETNSELGLGYTMYEKYFERNCGYLFKDVDPNFETCPQCLIDPPPPQELVNNNKSQKKKVNTVCVKKSKTVKKTKTSPEKENIHLVST